MMSDKHESMIGIMKLYELRREPVMRQARQWFDGFYAENFQEILELFKTEDERYFRMGLTYWDMAASFVNHGVIDEQMFSEIVGEHINVYAKIEPFVEDLRGLLKNPTALANLETLVLRTPNAAEIMAGVREGAKQKQTARQAAAVAA
jgi:hypothetical protein